MGPAASNRAGDRPMTRTADAVTVAAIMTRRVVGIRADVDLEAGVHVHPGDDLRTAAAAMLDGLVAVVLVSEDAGRVVGVLTWADIVAQVAGPKVPR
jgi:CBS domain-containing protein